ncbi:MAG: 6,7-dimethyl-8-ribityllumazine synthase [Acidobacteriota bacterium]
MDELQGKLESNGVKVGLVVGRFNELITERLLAGALETLTQNGVSDDDITLIRVPGSFEIPAAAQRLAKARDVDAIVCLGAVIRGETAHFEYISLQVSRGIIEVALKFDLPVSFGVITAETVEQAMDRSGAEHSNKGVEATIAALEMANLFKQLTPAP